MCIGVLNILLFLIFDLFGFIHSVAGGSIAHSVVMKSRRVPDPAVYTAYDPDTLEIVKLNRKDKLEVRPTLSHNWVTANAGDEKGTCDVTSQVTFFLNTCFFRDLSIFSGFQCTFYQFLISNKMRTPFFNLKKKNLVTFMYIFTLTSIFFKKVAEQSVTST